MKKALKVIGVVVSAYFIAGLAYMIYIAIKMFKEDKGPYYI